MLTEQRNKLTFLLIAQLLFTRSAVCQNPETFPESKSIKGLQVQMVDDALKLGIKHAGINFALNGLYATPGDSNAIKWDSHGQSFYFSKNYVESIDRTIKPLSDSGVIVYLIVLAMPSGNPELDKLLLHPKSRSDRQFPVGAFNTDTSEGKAWLAAALEFIMSRYSNEKSTQGRVWGWIIGNEVNSHFMWHNRGPSTLQEVCDGYEQTMRLAHTTLRHVSTNARLYISLDHNWNVAHTPDQPLNSVSGKALLDSFAKLARERGDFDWHIAFHPYATNLFSSEIWNDPVARLSPETPKITFHNLEFLCQYLDTPELHWDGKPRRLILSEQGFHSQPNPSSELQQAASYAYAWEKCKRLPAIDAFIYHRHVDHAHEGGLRLGLWRNVPGSIATPESTKPIYDLFGKAGTDLWEDAAKPFLPVTGLKSWDDSTATP